MIHIINNEEITNFKIKKLSLMEVSLFLGWDIDWLKSHNMNVYRISGRYKGYSAHQYSRISDDFIKDQGIKFIKDYLKKQLLEWCQENYQSMVDSLIKEEGAFV